MSRKSGQGLTAVESGLVVEALVKLGVNTTFGNPLCKCCGSEAPGESILGIDHGENCAVGIAVRHQAELGKHV